MSVIDNMPSFGIIKFLAGSQMDNVIQINKPTTTIGRDPDNDIVLTAQTISEHHARIIWNNGSWSIETISPENTIQVNKRDVQQAIIHDCDIVGIGTETTFIFLIRFASQKLLDSTSSDTEPLASEQLPTTSESMSAALQHSEPDRSPPSQEVEVPQQQDSLCIIEMMFLLRKLADKGHTIILVTHATNNINACDYVCFLAQGGRLVYFGPPSETRVYFGKADFAEIYALLEPSPENPQAPEEAETRFKASLDYQQYVSELINEVPVGNGKAPRQTKKTKQPKRGNPWKQFLLLSLRYIELLKNDPGNLLILLLQAPIIGLLLILLVKYEIGTGAFDATSIANCPTTATILTTTGLRDVPGPANPAVSIKCDRVDDFLKNEPNGRAYAAKRAGLMVGLTVSAIAPNNDRAMSFIPIILIPQVIFSGTVFAFKDWFTQFLSMVFAARWSMAALGSSMGLHSDKIGGDKLFGDDYTYHGTLFSIYNQADAMRYLLTMWIALGVMIVLLACATGVFLKRKDVRV